MSQKPGESPGTSSRKRILVVDDEPEVTTLVVKMLKRNGFDGWAVNDPLEVPQLSTEIHPDAIILDFEMPTLQGPEISVLLKSRPETSKIPVIFLSGMTDEDSRKAGAYSGAAEYLEKPVNEGKLIATLLRLIGRNEKSSR